MEHQVFAYVLTFLFVVLLTDFLARQAVQIGLVDRPDSRKRHRGAIPPVGGEAIFIGCLLSALALGVPEQHVMTLFAIGAVVVVVGALDDYCGFSPSSRLLAQVAVAVAMAVAGGATLEQAGRLSPGGEPLPLGVLSLPFTVLVTVGIINAFNLIDGMDGLSGSLALVALAGLAVLAGAGGETGLLALVMVLASGTAAFLALNVRSPWRWRASVFLGDSGSTFLGFALAWLMVELSQGPGAALSPVQALWLLAVPLFDTVSVMLRRIARGRSPLLGDRQHLHHFFLRAGLSVNQTLGVMLALAVLGAGVGLGGALIGVGDRVLLAAFLLLLVLYCTVMSAAWKAHPRIRRLVSRRLRGGVTMPVLARAHADPTAGWSRQLHTP